MLFATFAKAFDNLTIRWALLLNLDANVAVMHAVVLAPASEVRNAPTRHHRLCGRAALIDAGSAYVASLNKRRPKPRLRQYSTKRGTSLPRPNHNRLVVSGCSHGGSSCALIHGSSQI